MSGNERTDLREIIIEYYLYDVRDIGGTNKNYSRPTNFECTSTFRKKNAEMCNYVRKLSSLMPTHRPAMIWSSSA